MKFDKKYKKLMKKAKQPAFLKKKKVDKDIYAHDVERVKGNDLSLLLRKGQPGFGGQ